MDTKERPEADEIEITPEMIDAVWGASVSTDDLYDQKERIYAGIFGAMLIASGDPRLKGISKVSYRGAVLVRR